MNGHIEHDVPMDVVFLIEATAMNGIYINELKTNYIQPILEHFNQGPFENTENSCDNRNCLYTIMLYHAADIRPRPCCRTYAQEKDPHFVLSIIDKVRLVGGRAQSTANLVEGLATCLQFYDDIKNTRDGCQKYCILICNSAPNMVPVMENQQYVGNNLEQLASFFAEKKIMMSILSARKIPALFKLFEKTGGDLSIALSKNYSKNGRHLVLLNGLCLKERAISPSTVPAPHSTLDPSPKSINVGSPTPATYRPAPTSQPQTNQIQHPDMNSQQAMQSQQPQAQQQTPPQQLHPQQQQQVQQQQQPQQVQQPQQPQPQQTQQPQLPQGGLPHGVPSPQMVPQQSSQQQQAQNNRILSGNFNQQPGNFPRLQSQQPGKWSIGPGQRPPYNPGGNPQSALIAQLQQPPSSMIPQFPPGLPQPNNMINQPQNPQLHPQFSHPLKQPQPQIHVMTNNPVQHMPMNQPTEANQVPVPTDRQPIWQGYLEFTDKTRSQNEMNNQLSNITMTVQCYVTLSLKDKNADLKPELWPRKLVLQLLPRAMIGSCGNNFLKKAHSVLFHPTPGEALENLTRCMNNGLAGCVQFNNPALELKILVFLYTAEKNAYLGFIPTEQAAFMERLRKQIDLRKNQALQQQQRQLQVAQNQNAAGSQAGPPAPGLQGQAVHMLQNPNMNNPMSGGQNHMGSMLVNDMGSGNVGPSGPMMQVPGNQQTLMHPNLGAMSVQPNVMLRNNAAIMGPRIAMPPDPTLSQRQENLAHIQRLQQQLSAAQQQEQMYQKIVEQQPYGRPQMVHVQQSQGQPQRNLPNSVPTQPNTQFDDNNFDFLS